MAKLSLCIFYCEFLKCKRNFLNGYFISCQRLHCPTQSMSAVERRQMNSYSGPRASMNKNLLTVHKHELGVALHYNLPYHDWLLHNNLIMYVNTLALVLSVRECVTDVTPTNEP